MALNVVSLQPDTKEALRCLDDLRAKIESGEVVMFAAVGVTQNDSTFAWTGLTTKKTRLQMLGAIAELFFSYWNLDIKKE